MDAQDIAHFLYKGEGLNKTAIGMHFVHFSLLFLQNFVWFFSTSSFSFFVGDYLGEKNDFNEQVLKAFVELHDFTNLILVQALR